MECFLQRSSPTEAFEFEQVIGKGSFAKVYRARCRADNRIVAFKVIVLDNHCEEEGLTVELQRELVSLRDCQHPNIVQYEGAYLAAGRLWVAMEYCMCSLHGVLSSGKRPLSEEQIAAVMARALCGLNYLHTEQRLIHRDVKAGNILLTLRGEVKLADFGVSAQLGGTLSKRNTVIGTPMWMSPEMIEVRHDYTTGVHTKPHNHTYVSNALHARLQCTHAPF